MELMQMAGFLSLEFNAEVEGPFKLSNAPFPYSNAKVARVWLPNKRGVSLLERGPGSIELLTVREAVAGAHYWDGTPWRGDYSTPGTLAGVVDNVTLEKAREVISTLRAMSVIDPRDQ